jgi:LacI family transcriptional regulator, galactose operon repressor
LTTIADVAKRAGVSKVTVSRVINGAGNVRPATRERVEWAIQELQYLPSVAARSLRSKRTNALALIVPDITNPFWTTIARGVEDAAQSGGYSVLLCNSDENPEKQSHYIDVVIRQRVDGVIIAPYSCDAQLLKRLRERSIPTVAIDRCIDGWEVDTVTGDSFSGAFALVHHLVELGHRRIAIISGPQTTSSAEDRVLGYLYALEAAGITPDERLILRGEYRSVSGEALTFKLLDGGLPFTAIFAANNAIAIGVLTALEQRDLRIPRDISLVCFDDIPYLSHILPFLTAAVQPAYEMGLQSAQLLLNRLGGTAQDTPARIVLPTSLVVRYSCGSRGQQFSLPLFEKSSSEDKIPVNTLFPGQQHYAGGPLAGPYPLV